MTPVSRRSRQRLTTPRAAIGDSGESQLAAKNRRSAPALKLLRSGRSQIGSWSLPRGQDELFAAAMLATWQPPPCHARSDPALNHLLRARPCAPLRRDRHGQESRTLSRTVTRMNPKR